EKRRRNRSAAIDEDVGSSRAGRGAPSPCRSRNGTRPGEEVETPPCHVDRLGSEAAAGDAPIRENSRGLHTSPAASRQSRIDPACRSWLPFELRERSRWL